MFFMTFCRRQRRCRRCAVIGPSKNARKAPQKGGAIFFSRSTNRTILARFLWQIALSLFFPHHRCPFTLLCIPFPISTKHCPGGIYRSQHAQHSSFAVWAAGRQPFDCAHPDTRKKRGKPQQDNQGLRKKCICWYLERGLTARFLFALGVIDRDHYNKKDKAGNGNQYRIDSKHNEYGVPRFVGKALGSVAGDIVAACLVAIRLCLFV